MKALVVMFPAWQWSLKYWAWRTLQKLRPDIIKGLRKRLRLFCGYLSLYQKNVDPKGITMVFTRSLPKNLLEISQIVANLWGKVSRRTLLSQIPFVEDVDEELNALEKETQENLENQQKMFGNDPNTKLDQPGSIRRG